MFEILSPANFKRIPWKNGKGLTTELAINPGGTLQDFSWRLSTAQVNEDGPFSDFEGMERQLVLIEGAGIELQHQQAMTQRLEHFLSIARFDGGESTCGRLLDGPIRDFNLMTRPDVLRAELHTLAQAGQLSLKNFELGFVFALSHELRLQEHEHSLEFSLPTGHLAMLKEPSNWKIDGSGIIAIGLSPPGNRLTMLSPMLTFPREV